MQALHDAHQMPKAHTLWLLQHSEGQAWHVAFACSLHGEQSTTLAPCDCCRTLRCRPYMMPTSRR